MSSHQSICFRCKWKYENKVKFLLLNSNLKTKSHLDFATQSYLENNRNFLKISQKSSHFYNYHLNEWSNCNLVFKFGFSHIHVVVFIYFTLKISKKDKKIFFLNASLLLWFSPSLIDSSASMVPLRRCDRLCLSLPTELSRSLLPFDFSCLDFILLFEIFFLFPVLKQSTFFVFVLLLLLLRISANKINISGL